MSQKFFLFVVIIFLQYSCSTTKTLNFVSIKEEVLVANHQNRDKNAAIVKHDIVVKKALVGQQVKVKLEEEKLRLTFLYKDSLVPVDTIIIGKDFGLEDETAYRLADNYAYYGDIKALDKTKSLQNYDSLTVIDSKPLSIDYEVTNIDGGSSDFVTTHPLVYTDNKGVLQTFTVPFKFRPEVDDVPSTVTAGFNAGIAYGKQWSTTTVKAIYEQENGTMQGYDKRTKSFTAAPFAGLTSVSLSESNTGGDVENDRTVLGLSAGGTGVFTFNRFNLGLAVGWDWGLEDSSEWDYQGKMWFGLVLGLDLIK